MKQLNRIYIPSYHRVQTCQKFQCPRPLLHTQNVDLNYQKQRRPPRVSPLDLFPCSPSSFTRSNAYIHTQLHSAVVMPYASRVGCLLREDMYLSIAITLIPFSKNDNLHPSAESMNQELHLESNVVTNDLGAAPPERPCRDCVDCG